MDSQDALDDFVNEVVEEVVSSISSGQSVQSNGVNAVRGLASLVSHKRCAAIVCSSADFLLPPPSSPKANEAVQPPAPNAAAANNPMMQMMMMMTRPRPYKGRSGPAIENKTLLGKVFRLGFNWEDQAVWSKFKGVRLQRDHDNLVSKGRAESRAQQAANNSLLMAFLTGGPSCQSKVLRWIADALSVNTGASGMSPDPSKTSSKVFMLNLCAAMLKLCEPFCVKDTSKQDLIHQDFLNFDDDEDGHMGVFPLKGDDAVARCSSSQGEGDDGGEANDSSMTDSSPPKFNFITKCFYFAARALHLGFLPFKAQHRSLQQHIGHSQWQIIHQGGEWRTDERVQLLMAKQWALEIVAMDPEILTAALHFYNCAGQFMGKMSSGTLQQQPEHVIDDMCDLTAFVSTSRNVSMDQLSGLNFSSIFAIVVRLLSKDEHETIKNYNLRAKLGDTIANIFLPEEFKDKSHDDRKTVPFSCYSSAETGQPFLLTDVLAQDTLAPSLLFLYGEVERTDGEDKAKHRSNICNILKYLWQTKAHRPAFQKIAEDEDAFIDFANGIINETVTLISAIFEKLPEVRNYQLALVSARKSR